MPLRSFLFSSDEGTAALLRQILAGLGVEAESCSDAVVAAEKITNQPFQIVIIDWDKQPEAALLLTTARERKAAERPLTLAIVSDDKSVPGVLQAGANSILRKPIVPHQAKDTLTTARDLLRAKEGSAASASKVASAPPPIATSSSFGEKEKVLRAGEFLQSTPVSPSVQFETEPEPAAAPSLEQAVAEQVDPLKDLEPTAAEVKEETPEPTPPSAESEPRGLEWYKARLANRQPTPAQAQPAEPPKPRGNPELLGYDQTVSYSSQSASAAASADITTVAKPVQPKHEAKDEHQKAAELFAYIEGERPEPKETSQFRFPFGKKAIAAAFVLAAFAVAAAPQAPWHSKFGALWVSGRQRVQAWLNPQPATPVQAPAAHEDFARPGDEYKLPVAEAIPDATTDPSQIQVVPEVDPTLKKPNNDGANPDQTAAQPDGTAAVPADSTQTPAPQVLDGQSPQNAATPAASTPAPVPTVAAPSTTTPTEPVAAVASSPLTKPAATVPKNPQPHYVSAPGSVPSSLRSQLAPVTDVGGAKAAETALPSIEPVNVPEATERALLADQVNVTYPDNAKGQQGTVVLQVLVGRNGSVQDAKFLQGSLVFARAAIDGVKAWKFKPYTMNGRPVSVQTQLTIKFKPAQ